jgi:hypothetical protein
MDFPTKSIIHNYKPKPPTKPVMHRYTDENKSYTPRTKPVIHRYASKHVVEESPYYKQAKDYQSDVDKWIAHKKKTGTYYTKFTSGLLDDDYYKFK